MNTRNNKELVEEIALHIMTAGQHDLQQMPRYSIADFFEINENILFALLSKTTQGTIGRSNQQQH